MKLIIDIPNEQYEYIKLSDKNTFAAVASKECMLFAIKNGTPISSEGDLISRSGLKEKLQDQVHNGTYAAFYVNSIIDNALTLEEIEKPFITKCRDTAIEKNIPLYFVYYEETGVFEVYVTETKELFEKRHCSKQLSSYEFQEIVNRYLEDYSEWKGSVG